MNEGVSGQLGEGIGSLIGSLIGIPYAVLVEFSQFIDAVRSGQMGRGAEYLAPVFLRNIMSAYRLATEGQTTMSGKPINVPGEKGPRALSAGQAVAKSLGFQPTENTKAFEVYKTMEELKSYRNQKLEVFANRYMAAKRKGDRKAMAQVRAEIREWNRKVVLEGRRELKIDLNRSIRTRNKVRQPMRQMRGLAKDLRDAYGV